MRRSRMHKHNMTLRSYCILPATAHIMHSAVIEEIKSSQEIIHLNGDNHESPESGPTIHPNPAQMGSRISLNPH